MKKLLGLCVLACSALTGATFTYDVAVNTASLSATQGTLYFQFNPGDVSSDAALASISNFTIGAPGSLTGASALSGGALGTLPSSLAIANSASNNDALQALTFGSALSFRLSIAETFTGLASTGSVFNFGLFQSDGLTPLLTLQPDGYSLIVNLNNRNGASASSTTALATITALVTAVPEPKTAVMFGAGLAGVIFLRIRAVRRKVS